MSSNDLSLVLCPLLLQCRAMGLVSLRAIEGVQMLCKAKNATGLQTLLPQSAMYSKILCGQTTQESQP